MEYVLIPPTDGDDWTVPEPNSEHVPPDEPTSDDPEDDLPPDETAAVDEQDEDADEAAEPEGDPTADPDHEFPGPPETDPAMVFADLKLMRPLMDAITAAGYTHPTPIQEAVIPPALRGKDVIGQAQTGTGKTAAFLIPFLNRWRPHTLKGPIGVVMTPTRELALQIATEADKLAPSSKFRCVAGLRRHRDAAAARTASPAAATSSSARRAGCSTTCTAVR